MSAKTVTHLLAARLAARLLLCQALFLSPLVFSGDAAAETQGKQAKHAKAKAEKPMKTAEKSASKAAAGKKADGGKSVSAKGKGAKVVQKNQKRAAPKAPPLTETALAAASAGRLDEALSALSRAGAHGDALKDVARGLALAKPGYSADFDVFAGFLTAHPAWPGLNGVRYNAEQRLPATWPYAQIIGWFDKSPPVSTTGMIRYADALRALGRNGERLDRVRRWWVDTNFTGDEEANFRAVFAGDLRQEDAKARFDRLLEDGQKTAALRVLPLMEPWAQAVAAARVKLSEDAHDARQAVDALPYGVRQDPGLLLDEVRWLRRARQDRDAISLLTRVAAPVGTSEPWWKERAILARRLIEQGDFRGAYALAAAHGQTENKSVSEAEWLSGWLALRFLQQPDVAWRHFDRMYRAVSSPISQSRGAYWAARAAEALGQREVAAKWYQTAAQHRISYYGQLAADRLQPGAVLALPAGPAVSAKDRAAYAAKDVIRAARALQAVGADEMAKQFLRAELKQAERPADYALLAETAQALGYKPLALTISKDAAQRGIVLLETGYPTLDFSISGGEANPALVHALIRQESLFDPKATSPVGAKGLMQLMPATAKEVARKQGLSFSEAQLTNPRDNVRLGSAYIQNRVNAYDGSLVLAIASYNAGPGRVSEWVSTFGDPRSGRIDPVDWVELIPVYETRNYVQRVLENLQIYRARLHNNAGALRLAQDLGR
jgi:soluble lytic murein transglycosylase